MSGFASFITASLGALKEGISGGKRPSRDGQPASSRRTKGSDSNALSLQLRPVVNNNEAIIWRWLRATFPNQRVLVKVPFSRFTSPTGAINRTQFELLNSLYTSFAIADRDGNVIGCIELEHATSFRTQPELKQDLLERLGITYEVLNGSDLPTAADFRARVLARSEESPDSTFEEMLDDAKVQLQQLLVRQRVRRHPESTEFRPSDLQHFSPHDSEPTSWNNL